MRPRAVWAGLYFVVVTAALYAAFGQRHYDDPFITYRYAQNLAQGTGLVYNAGERVLSTTTPGFTLLLAALSPLWPDLPALANLVGAASLAAAALCGWWLAAGQQGGFSPWKGLPLLVLLPLFPLVLNTLGSETPLYIALSLATFVCYARQRYTLAALCAAAATLVRPDGILVALVVGAGIALSWLIPLRQGRTAAIRAHFRRLLPGLLLFGALLAAWGIFSWIYFGSPLPVTLAAKQSQGSMGNSQSFAEGFAGYVRQYSRGWQYWLEAGLATAGLTWAAVRRRRGLQGTDFLIPAWTGVYFVAYTALGITRYFWYYAPLVPGFLLLAGWGLAALAALPLPKGNRRWGRLSPWLPAQVLAALVLAALGVAHLQAASNLSQLDDGTYSAYRAVGEWLATNTPPGATVGALEVGVIGYYAQRPMVDFAGLLQPEVALQLRGDSSYEESVLWAMGHYHPEYVLLFPGTFPRADALAATLCHPLQRFAGADYGYWRDIIVHDCR